MHSLVSLPSPPFSLPALPPSLPPSCNEILNVGLTWRVGELLCFVHADSRPPPELVQVIRNTLSHRGTVLGAFRTVIKHGGRTLGFMTWHHLVKTYYLPLIARPLSFLRYQRPSSAFPPFPAAACFQPSAMKASFVASLGPTVGELHSVLRGPLRREGATRRREGQLVLSS